MRRSPMIQALALSVALVVLLGGVAHAQVELEPVVTGRSEQYFGFANDSYLAFTQSRRGVETALARPLAGGTSTTLNAEGTEGLTGGFDPGTNRVLIQQFRWDRGRSDLYFYDLDTDERSKVPGVNTRAWEYLPRISSTFIAFLRARPRNGTWYASLHVFHRQDEEIRTVGTWKEGPPLFVSSAGDHFVTYTRCSASLRCHAYIYDWETDAQQRMPSVNRRSQYAPVIDEVNSTVYFARSGGRCGQNVNIWRRPIPLAPEDELTKIVDLPDGIDTGFTASLTQNVDTGQMDLYMERWDCADEDNDIYVGRGVDAEPR